MFTFGCLLGFTFLVIAIKTHPFCYLWQISMRTSALLIFLFPLFFTLGFEDVQEVLNGLEQVLLVLFWTLKEFLLQVEAVCLDVIHEPLVLLG